MFISNQSLVSLVISQSTFTDITHLWENLVTNNPTSIYLKQDNQTLGKKLDSKNHNFYSFQLFIADDLQCLWLVEKKINSFLYQITITFDSQEILDFLDLTRLSITPHQSEQIHHIFNSSKITSILKENFIFSLLKIVAENQDNNYDYLGVNSSSKSVESVLRNKIAQEKIIHQVTQQIQQDLDPLIIVKITIEQVQSLLQLDRLLVYQINVPVKENSETKKYIDIVTHEAKASQIIPSVLNFSEETCFQNHSKFYEKYLRKYTLTVNDVENFNLDQCLKEVMVKLKVKAKIVTPIIVNNQLWGLLIAHQCFKMRQWKQSEVKFLENIAEYLALAVYQYNSYQKLQEQKNLLEEQIERKAKQLKDALIIAEIAHQSKTEFLGSISHELRTPLTCIIGLSGTLLHWSKEKKNDSLSPEKRVRYLQIIQDSGRKLLQLINNMLDFADLEAGKSLLYIEEISLENFCKFVYLSSLESAKNRGITLNFDYQVSNNLDTFHGDEERLYQVLLNLVDNAIKFTPSGGVVTFRVKRNKHQTIFQIEDTGIGIDKNQIPLLFTEFQQLENYRSRIYAGTGLGLALSKHLVELHGGIIEVESVVGEGSKFTVLLPDYEVKNSLKSEYNQDNYDLLKVNKTIVIVCDDDETGTFLCELLTAADYQVIWLVDIQEAVSRIRLINPIIVIIQQEKDISFTTVESIKSQDDLSFHLIVIKNEIKGDEWENLSNSKVDEYILKPLQPRILLKKISQIINQ